MQSLPVGAVSGLYLHWPLCFHKCHYCDFYSIAEPDDRGNRSGALVERMVDEIAALGPLTAGAIRTIFVGGGTPTLLEPAGWRRLLAAVHGNFDLSGLVEFTVEANPETVTAELLDTLVGGGVNRLSIGCQSFDPRHLKTLERWHEPASVARSVDRARAAGLTNINLDLIYAIPGQALAEWRDDLARALALGPTHLSCYSLTYEPNTAMTMRLQRGAIEPADPALEAAMFEATIDTLTAAGFEHYEVSNFARPGDERPGKATLSRGQTSDASGEPVAPGEAEGPSRSARGPSARCLHNMLYWRNGQWLAIGPSASGHVAGVRWKNLPHVGRYLASTGGAPIDPGSIERLDEDASVGEQLMLGLRLIEGVRREAYEHRLGPRRQHAIEALIERGLIERTDTHLRLSRAGLMIGDAVIAELL